MTSIVLFSLTILLTSTKATDAQGSEPTLTVNSGTLQACPPKEAWTTCGNACRERCGSGLHSICPEVCKIGCSCKSGYKRDKNGRCVLENECPGPCYKPNEAWTTCGNPCIEQCDGSDRACTMECRTGCYCKTGYKRLNGTCIPKMKCPYNPPPKCPGFYEIYKKGVNCTDFCNKHLIQCKAIPEYGCYCKDGYARDLKTGVCRPYPCKDCGKNAEWINCAGACDNHCDFLLGRDTCKIRYFKCPDGCRCKKGFARRTNSTTSACIPERKCL